MFRSIVSTTVRAPSVTSSARSRRGSSAEKAWNGWMSGSVSCSMRSCDFPPRPPRGGELRCVAFAGLAAVSLAAGRLAAGEAGLPVYRSPVDLVLAPDESWLLTANSASGTVSLVRIADGQVLAEREAGAGP